jgi:hypothetical protein
MGHFLKGSRQTENIYKWPCKMQALQNFAFVGYVLARCKPCKILPACRGVILILKSSGKFEIENALPEKNAKFENCAADKKLKSKRAQNHNPFFVLFFLFIT